MKGFEGEEQDLKDNAGVDRMPAKLSEEGDVLSGEGPGERSEQVAVYEGN